ncbi:MAG: ComF family protein [Clostridiaceae bacterium]|jgi:ComF family protein|nr:ComF family protein [Clostridiaceae bacterium]
MWFSEIIKRALHGFKNALYPAEVTCDACGNELTGRSRYRLCAECTETLPIIKSGEEICPQCGVPVKNEAVYCLRCQNMRSKFELNRSPLVYEGLAVTLVHKLKFGGQKYLAEALSAMLADCFWDNGMSADVILYVPMTKREQRVRGFNQSELLARGLSKRLNVPLSDALIKIKDTKGQRGLSAEERRKNLEGAFHALPEVSGKNCLLIDDVFTTGTTINECASALRHAHAKSVCSMTLSIAVLKLDGEKQKEEKGAKPNAVDG